MSVSSFLETEYIILHDKRDFIDVLKLRMGRLSWFIWIDVITQILKKGK